MLNNKIEQVRQKIENLVKNGASRDSVKEILYETGLKKTQVNFWANHFCGKEINNTGIKIEKSPTENTVEYSGKELINVENLLNKCNIDKSKWEVLKYTLDEKHVVTKTEFGPEFTPKYDLKAYLVKKNPNINDILNQFIESASKYAPKFKYKKIPSKSTKKEYLLELSIFDLHISKLIWSAETNHGNDYDLNKAIEIYNKSVDSLLSRINKSEISEILFPLGNDFFNSDNESYTTTAGTQQHDDSRWQKSFNFGCKLAIDTIDKLTSFCNKVTVIIIPGNHDRHKVYYLGEYLTAWYKNSDRVTIDNKPTKRKYFKFGKSLIGFTHGNSEKHNDLPLIMAREMPVDWGESKWYYWHLGHLHHQITRDIKGVIIDIMPSLCPADEWHNTMGFSSNVRSAQAFLYDKMDGLITVHYYKA